VLLDVHADGGSSRLGSGLPPAPLTLPQQGQQQALAHGTVSSGELITAASPCTWRCVLRWVDYRPSPCTWRCVLRWVDHRPNRGCP